ncbi:hypothetical protein V8J88_01170 [Massilia sp. W12]|uniref:hypothetical protein n=1 Tax=Massilia sp. W12 TaxID=3126507 RepID=UPI0030CCC83B
MQSPFYALTALACIQSRRLSRNWGGGAAAAGGIKHRDAPDCCFCHTAQPLFLSAEEAPPDCLMVMERGLEKLWRMICCFYFCDGKGLIFQDFSFPDAINEYVYLLQN